MNLRLLIQTQNDTIAWQFRGQSVRLGRKTDCELAVSGSNIVSGRHARLEYGLDGWMLWDLNSTNGTFLNGRRLQHPQPVKPGDVIHLGVSGPKVEIVELRQPSSITSKQPVSNAVFRTPCAVAIPGPSPARLQLMGIMRRQTRSWIIKACLAAALMLFFSGFLVFYSPHTGKSNDAVKSGAPTTAPVLISSLMPKNSEIYKKALRHACYIRFRVPGKGFATGSGSVIDKAKGLILTNYHVVDEKTHVEVFLPRYQPNGDVIGDKKQYLGGKITIAKVLAREKKVDLAVIQVDSIPRTSGEVTLADYSPHEGDRIHLVGGNPMGSGNAMWGYVNGTVRSVMDENISLSNHLGKIIYRVDGKLIRSDIRSNPGDSGAGVINDSGLLVAVNFAGSHRGDRIHMDITDVKRFLGRHGFLD